MLFSIGVFICLFVSLSIRWCLKTWKNISMHEFVYTLSQSIRGTSNEMLLEFVLECVVAAVVLTAVIGVAVYCVRKRKYGRWCRRAVCVGMPAILLFSGVWFCVRLNVVEYVVSRVAQAYLIDENYVDPQTVEIRFPEKKRNLIYIYLESMETTYADTAHGGAFEENVIPELTKMAMQYEDFSGAERMLNGANVITGAGWTMGALFAHTSGIPLQIPIQGNTMDTQSEFFPAMCNLGDILKANGYAQYFLCGSDAAFGGRDLFFSQHGDYEIIDYYAAVKKNWISPGYRVFWGYEDEKLFANAKELLMEISQKEEPFNLTMLTVDTHFEDGYICRLCEDEAGKSQYANVMSCASRQVEDFVRWIQEQPFYENTTIVLVGDHLTMDSDFCDAIDKGYERRAYTCLINAAAEREEKDMTRIYTTYDLFPTTLAAIGASIQGERLGMGTNLFSDVSTYAEMYGVRFLHREFGKTSKVIEGMSRFDLESDKYLKAVGLYPSALVNTADSGGVLTITVSQIEKLESCKDVVLRMRKDEKTENLSFDRNSDGYALSFALDEYEDVYESVDVCLVDQAERAYPIAAISADLKLYTNNICAYLNHLKEAGYTVFFSIADEGTASLTNECMETLEGLGLKQNLLGKFRYAYGAVLNGERVLEESLSEDVVTIQGRLDSGETFAIHSAGYGKSDCLSSVIIDGNEYSPAFRGLNIVVYDEAKKRVIDQVCFDTHEGNAVVRPGIRNETFIYP